MAATRLIALHASKGKTIQCDPKTATEEFMLSKRLYSQITGKDQDREEIMLHRAAKDTFDRLGTGKIPTVKALEEEYAQVLTVKKKQR